MGLFIETLITLLVLVVLVWVIVLIAKRFSKKLTVNQKKWWLIIHIGFVIIYFGGLLGTLLLANVATTKVIEQEQIYAAHLFSKYCDWYLIIPGAFGCLITGVWLSMRTHWGLTNYRWVMVKLFGHIGAILYGSSLMRVWFDKTVELSLNNQLNPLQNPAYIHNRQMLIMGTIISLSILTFILITSYLKPWGKIGRAE